MQQDHLEQHAGRVDGYAPCWPCAVPVLLALLAVTSGCALCCSPYDDHFAAYGGVRDRMDRTRGRVGSVFDPAPAAGTERLVPVERVIVPAAGYQERVDGEETLFDALSEPGASGSSRPAPGRSMTPGAEAAPPVGAGVGELPEPEVRPRTGTSELPELSFPEDDSQIWSPDRPSERAVPELQPPADDSESEASPEEPFDPAILFD